MSAAYQRSSNALAENASDDRFYSHALRPPLEAEVLADAISDVLGLAEEYGQEPIGTRAIALVHPQVESKSLDILGRCSRAESCESSSAPTGGLPLKLHLMNGPLLNERIARSGGRLDRLIKSGMEPLAIVQEFYQHALSRRPNQDERQYWQAQLSKAHSKDEVRAVVEDFVWSLLTCNEFTTHH
jgi:hypothetical protein